MLGRRYFGLRYFGRRYFGGEELPSESTMFGDRYFGSRYFGARYFGGTVHEEGPEPEDLEEFRNAIEASISDENLVIFATISHPDLIEPYRFNSDVVDYVYDGDTYVAAAFQMTLLSDDEQPPRAQAAIHNVDQLIGDIIQSLETPPRIDIHVFVASDFTDADPRVEIDTAVIEYWAPHLLLRNVKCSAETLTGEIVGADLTAEPWPAIRSTKERLPGLFR
jgi:hypothetical protein